MVFFLNLLRLWLLVGVAVGAATLLVSRQELLVGPVEAVEVLTPQTPALAVQGHLFKGLLEELQAVPILTMGLVEAAELMR
jgi:hypothetical protein